MHPSPCATLCPARVLKSRPRLGLRTVLWVGHFVLAGLALALLICPARPGLAADLAPEQAALILAAQDSEPDRGLGPAPARYVLIKAVGQGETAEAADQDALHNARLVATRHYAALGGATALTLSSQGLRIIATHHSPPIGFAAVRAVVLVEVRLHALAEPPPAALALPVLRVSVETPAQIEVEASRACEIMIALDPGPTGEPLLLPGGGGAAYRLAPGRPMQQPLPRLEVPASLHVLACTGGIYAPVPVPTVDAAFAKARVGKPHPVTMQGVVSECVEVQTILPAPAAPADMPKRSMRQKGSETPVNMTGAAGRESGLPILKDQP